jgi:N-acyl-D-amino-acid deacylase
MEFDLVIQNGTVIDGTGQPRYRADIGLTGNRIAVISPHETLHSQHEIDASSLIVAPGFIDLHSHADWILPLPDHDKILAPLLQQGITTIVTGNCGFSPAPVTSQTTSIMNAVSEMLRDREFEYRWESLRDFMNTLQSDGLLMNTVFQAGHGTIRSLVMDARSDAPTESEINEMRRLTRQTLHEGAIGLSAGLAYAPGVFARNEELLALLQVVAQQDGLFTVHGRAYSWVSPFYKPMFLGAPHTLRSVREQIQLAREAGVRLQLSHQIFVGRRTWRTHKAVLQEIDRAAQEGLDIAFDAYPFTVGFSTIKVIFPEWFLDGFLHNVHDEKCVRQLKKEITLLQIALGIQYSDIRLLSTSNPTLLEFEGLNFDQIARMLNKPHFEAYMHIARESEGNARILLGTYSGDEQNDQALRNVLSHPLCGFMTDTILTSHSQHNPSSFGAFPRILGHYSRDLGLFSLEEAVRRMTSFSAARIGINDIGRLAEGLAADLVIFDPATIADNTTPEKRDAAPTGIHHVILSGKIAVQYQSTVPGLRAGRILSKT